MCIVLITQGISRIVKPFLNSKHTIAGIIDAAPRGKLKQNFGLPWRKSLKKLSKKHAIPYYYMNNGSDMALQDWVQNINPDIMVVFSMSQLLRENIFALPTYGTINLHPSYLPEYRGPNPDFWIYYNMDLNPGVTVHYIDKDEDTGDVIFQERYTIPLGINSPTMRDIGIDKIGVNLLFRAIDAIEDGNVPRISQPEDSPTPRARNLKLAEHKNIIDWNSFSVGRIWHILRGTESWLNALEQPSGLFKGQRWEIGGFAQYSDYSFGTIQKKKGLFVACKDGEIMVKLHFSIKVFIKQIMMGVYGIVQNIIAPPPINDVDTVNYYLSVVWA